LGTTQEYLVLRFKGITDVGQKRDDNEDRFVVNEDRQYAILADGMGGRMYGEVASTMAVEFLSRCIENERPKHLARLDRNEQGAMLTNLMDEWVRGVNGAIYQKGQQDERYRDMGTTLVAIVGFGPQALLVHVGDSRAYSWHEGVLKQITEDHSFVNSQVKQGMMTEQEARESNQRNIITRAVGTADRVKPDITIHTLRKGERLILCSDGLSDMIDDAAISAIMGQEGDLEASAEALVDAANEAGGKDNITVILAELAS
jgi:protein phosphatase